MIKVETFSLALRNERGCLVLLNYYVVGGVDVAVDHETETDDFG